MSEGGDSRKNASRKSVEEMLSHVLVGFRGSGMWCRSRVWGSDRRGRGLQKVCEAAMHGLCWERVGRCRSLDKN